MEKGLIHLYHGDGKGKTTCGMGLCLRAYASSKKVVIVQFLKSGASPEVLCMKESFNIPVYAGKSFNGFTWDMKDDEKPSAITYNNEMFKRATNEDCDVLLLDEILATLDLGLIDISLIEDFILNKPEHLELILTGRNPSEFILSKADYITEMKKIRHPYDKGIQARKGIEY